MIQSASGYYYCLFTLFWLHKQYPIQQTKCAVFIVGCLNPNNLNLFESQGPVVQNFVSLTSLLSECRLHL